MCVCYLRHTWHAPVASPSIPLTCSQCNGNSRLQHLFAQKSKVFFIKVLISKFQQLRNHLDVDSCHAWVAVLFRLPSHCLVCRHGPTLVSYCCKTEPRQISTTPIVWSLFCSNNTPMPWSTATPASPTQTPTSHWQEVGGRGWRARVHNRCHSRSSRSNGTRRRSGRCGSSKRRVCWRSGTVVRTRRGRRTRGFWAPNGQEQWSKRTMVKQYNRWFMVRKNSNNNNGQPITSSNKNNGQPITSSNNNNGQTNNIVQ